MRNVFATGVMLVLTSVAAAQEATLPFDGDAFAREVNAAIKAQQLTGVTVTGDPKNGLPATDFKWAQELGASPPQFGVVVLDKDHKPVDVLGESAPLVVNGADIAIAGYNLPPGGSFKTVGAAEWTKTVAELASSESVQPPSDDIAKAVGVVANATDYIADQLCKRKSRPTKIVFHLTAGFELVFNAETGSEVEWDLEVVCPRMAQ